MTVCDRGEGGGSKIIKKSVTYFMDGPQFTPTMSNNTWDNSCNNPSKKSTLTPQIARVGNICIIGTRQPIDQSEEISHVFSRAILTVNI